MGIYEIVKVYIPKTQNIALRKTLSSKKKYKYGATRTNSVSNLKDDLRDIQTTPRQHSINVQEAILKFKHEEFLYFQRLIEFNEMYIKALLQTSDFQSFANQLKEVFEPILTLSRNVITSMEEINENKRNFIGIYIKNYLDKFTVFTSYFSAYQSLTKNFPEVQEHLELNKNLVMCIASFIQAQKNIALANGQVYTPPLPQTPIHYLHLPIQRLETYVTFFELMKLNVPTLNDDYPNIVECYESISSVYKSSLSLLENRAANDDVGIIEKILRRSTSALVTKRRKLVYFGFLIPLNDEISKKVPRLCFLFNDLLLITSVKKMNGNSVDQGGLMRKFTSQTNLTINDIKSYVVNEEFRVELNPPITVLTITDDEIKNGFMILQDDFRLHFIACSENQRDEWTHAIETL